MNFDEIQTPNDLHEWARDWAASDSAFEQLEGYLECIFRQLGGGDHPEITFRRSAGVMRLPSGEALAVYFLRFNEIAFVLARDWQSGRYYELHDVDELFAERAPTLH